VKKIFVILAVLLLAMLVFPAPVSASDNEIDLDALELYYDINHGMMPTQAGYCWFNYTIVKNDNPKFPYEYGISAEPCAYTMYKLNTREYTDEQKEGVRKAWKDNMYAVAMNFMERFTGKKVWGYYRSDGEMYYTWISFPPVDPRITGELPSLTDYLDKYGPDQSLKISNPAEYNRQIEAHANTYKAIFYGFRWWEFPSDPDIFD
jgi:hypothetical protein